MTTTIIHDSIVRRCRVGFVVVGLVLLVAVLYLSSSDVVVVDDLLLGVQQQQQQRITTSTATSSKKHNNNKNKNNNNGLRAALGPCSINLYGLPRSFRSLVLPSLVENVIRVNAKYNCDYYVHYFDVSRDPIGRDGKGGIINPKEILELRTAVLNIHHSTAGAIVNNNNNNNNNSSSSLPIVKIIHDTEETFVERRGNLLSRIFSNDVFIPTNHFPSYTNTTITNIIKMWHGQEAVFDLMIGKNTRVDDRDGNKAGSNDNGRRNRKHYSRVAMLRCDVVYVTPIDIYQLPSNQYDIHNQYAIIPNFANHPVNDRMMIGAFDAVRYWAAQRFAMLKRHAQHIAPLYPGDGIHSELYLSRTIFPAITNYAGTPILQDSQICFLRSRADLSLRFDDCGLDKVNDHNQRVIERIINRTCLRNVTENGKIVHLECQDRHNKKKQSLTEESVPTTSKNLLQWKM